MGKILLSVVCCLLITFTSQFKSKVSVCSFSYLSALARPFENVNSGSRLPLDCSLQTLVNNKIITLQTAEIFAGKKVAVIGIPGCFTKTCQKHLKSFRKHHTNLKKMVDLVVCISVNDAYVMDACKKFLAYDDILMLSDGDATFARNIGLAMDTGSFGGVRLNRLSMLVDDGVIVDLNVEKDGAYTSITSADTLVQKLGQKM